MTEQKTTKESDSVAKASNKTRRGPNSHRVKNMFASVGAERVLLDDLIRKHNVSIHVARQSKRFDPARDSGQIVIKTLTDEATGAKKTWVWRVPSESRGDTIADGQKADAPKVVKP